MVSSGSMGETRDDQDKKEEEEEDKRTRHVNLLVGFVLGGYAVCDIYKCCLRVVLYIKVVSYNRLWLFV